MPIEAEKPEFQAGSKTSDKLFYLFIMISR